MSKPWCKHYRGMSERDHCEAGVTFASLENAGTRLFMQTCPCFGPEQSTKCDLAKYPTAEEMAAEEEEFEKRLENTIRARAAIVQHLGKPWKKGMSGSQGLIDCPVCKGTATLHFTRAGYNGHIHARCVTVDCVSWME